MGASVASPGRVGDARAVCENRRPPLPGPPDVHSITLRPWQRAAFELFRHADGPDFLAVATPGAGKTTFALACARAQLADWGASGTARRLIVVAPTSHLKVQWSLAAHRLGLQLDPDWAPGYGLARDVHGLVTTYQQVATGDAAAKLQGMSADAMVILDEVHHAGHERAWGDGIGQAFGHAGRRLSLSGTPFRSDAAKIPFVRYDGTAEGDEAYADYTYGYADALRDGGVVRPVYFPRVDGQMEWSTPAGDVVRASFDDELARDQVSARLRTALSLDGDWIAHVLGQAHDRLRAIRADQPDAGGLVIATDQDHAQGIARMLRHRFDTPAEVVVSDDPTASRKIAEFAGNDRPWLVSVRMVSEGVDIPRLRVGVYATTTSTELFFRQAVGRFVRFQAGRSSQKAYVYVPDDPRLRTHAFQIAEAPAPCAAAARRARRRVLPPTTPASTRSSPTASCHPSSCRCSRCCRRPRPASRSMRSPSRVSNTSTTSPTHRARVRRRPRAGDRPARGADRSRTPAVGHAQRRRAQGRSADPQRRRRQASRRRDRVEPRPVQGEMNRLAGVTKVSTATVEQLERTAAIRRELAPPPPTRTRLTTTGRRDDRVRTRRPRPDHRPTTCRRTLRQAQPSEYPGATVSSDALDDDRRGHAAAGAHRDQGDLAVGAFELVERRPDEDRPGRTDR